MTTPARLLAFVSLFACAGTVWLVFSAHRRDWFLLGVALLGIAGWNVVGWMVMSVLEAEPER